MLTASCLPHSGVHWGPWVEKGEHSVCLRLSLLYPGDLARLCFWNWGLAVRPQEDAISMNPGASWDISLTPHKRLGLGVFQKGETKTEVHFKEGTSKCVGLPLFVSKHYL